MPKRAENLSEGLERLLKSVAPIERRKMARKMAIALRASMSDNILANREPDGSPMAPRLPQRREKRRRGKMFQKLGRRSRLRTQQSANRAAVFIHYRDFRIARIHQEGLRSQVNRSGLTIRYTRRRLMGVSENERRIVRDLIYQTLAGEA